MSKAAPFRSSVFGIPRRLVRVGIEKPGATMWFWIVLSLLLAATLTRLDFDTSTSTFLDQSSPVWQIYQRSLDQFGGDEFIVVALEAENPFEPETLEAPLTATWGP